MTAFKLVGRVSSENLKAVRAVVEQLAAGSVAVIDDSLHVEGVMDGEDARDVNRRPLSALRSVERRTRLRAEWTAGGTTYRFFDYVLKGTKQNFG